jgi:hypothetical protein
MKSSFIISPNNEAQVDVSLMNRACLRFDCAASAEYHAPARNHGQLSFRFAGGTRLSESCLQAGQVSEFLHGFGVLDLDLRLLLGGLSVLLWQSGYFLVLLGGLLLVLRVFECAAFSVLALSLEEEPADVGLGLALHILLFLLACHPIINIHIKYNM